MSNPRPESRSRAVLKTTVAAVCAGSITAATVAPVQAAPEQTGRQAGPVMVRVGRSQDFTRVEFAGAAGARAAVRRDGRNLIVSVPGSARPDIAQLKVNPPPGVVSVAVRPISGGSEVVFVLDEGADFRSGRADGAVWVNLLETARPSEAAAGPAPQAPGPSPVPAGGVVRVVAETEGEKVTFRFPWAQPVGAAVFRRGPAVWVAFDARARVALPGKGADLGAVTDARATNGEGYTVVRFAAPETAAVAASADGSSWSITIGGQPTPARDDVKVLRDEADGLPALSAAIAGATRVVWIRDPLVGDRFAAVTTLAPNKPMGRERRYLETALLQTAHGLGIEAPTGDLQVALDGDLVRISRKGGLSLSPAVAEAQVGVPADLPQPAPMPGLIDFTNWSRVGAGGFRARYAQLQDLAAAEAAKGEEAPVAARMALARFLIGTELSYEAIGVLELLARQRPEVLNNPEFRGLRGAARAMVGRWVEAQTDFSVPSLTGDPASALWRGYVDARQGHLEEARRAFAEGASAVDQFAPRWRARFAVEHARAALELGDDKAASRLVAYAVEQDRAPLEQLAARLVQARVFETQGQTDRALRMYDAIGRAPLDSLAAPARMRATKIRLDRGTIKPVDAVKTLDGLRWRWRGDATELEIIRTLGDIYLSQGRYREALDALRSAGTRLPNLPQAVALQADLAAAFRALFLEGKADGLEPVQALALFFDFRELTPVGADGDEMVRRLARRLVDVDLLAQAAELLKYQVDNRLDGVAKSQVATDLAAIYLMDRKPEPALQALWSSRTTLLPAALNSERRVLEARALAGLGRYDHALEVLGADDGPDAQEARAEILWKQKDWAGAAALLEKRLGDRWKNPAPLTADEETRLVRAGIAYSLANDNAALDRLGGRYDAFIAKSQSPEALRVALSRDVELISPADFARASAQADNFTGWVTAMKKKFRERAPMRNAAAKPVAPAKPAAPASRAAAA